MDHDLGFLDDLSLAADRVSVGESDRTLHATDWGTDEADGTVPAAVVYPESTEEVSTVLSAANERGVPVTPYAAGSGLEGAAVPEHGGISLDLTRLDTIHEIRPADRQIDVGAGVIGSDVNEAIARHGLFFPPLPSSGDLSTIGGMIATDASGMGTVKYGEVADWVLAVEAVRADGTVIRAGSKATKTSSGYNLLDLLIGSEGTLAVVTEATLELSGRHEQIRGGRATFETLDDATAAVADAVATGVDVAKIELLDRTSVRIANEYLALGLPESPTLFVEFHANHGIEEEIAFCRDVFDAHDVRSFEVASNEETMAELWEARRELAEAVTRFDPDRAPLYPVDVTVPVSAFPDLIRSAKAFAEEAGFTVPCYGHAGDGNLHCSLLADSDDPDAVRRARECSESIVERALELDGTATGEHGIGRDKRKYLRAEHGESGVETMRAIKDALDPEGTLNPGAIFPEDR